MLSYPLHGKHNGRNEFRSIGCQRRHNEGNEERLNVCALTNILQHINLLHQHHHDHVSSSPSGNCTRLALTIGSENTVTRATPNKMSKNACHAIKPAPQEGTSERSSRSGGHALHTFVLIWRGVSWLCSDSSSSSSSSSSSRPRPVTTGCHVQRKLQRHTPSTHLLLAIGGQWLQSGLEGSGALLSRGHLGVSEDNTQGNECQPMRGTMAVQGLADCSPDLDSGLRTATARLSKSKWPTPPREVSKKS